MTVLKAFRYQDEKSDKFWLIRHEGGEAYAVTYGKWQTQGRCEIKEFASPEECAKQVDKQIAAKTKKGYQPVEDFDFTNRHYLDSDEYGPDRLTSHPRFTAHFTEDFYYDCADEEAPFGSDEGADTLAALEAAVKKDKDANITLFPRQLVEQDWDLTYYPPEQTDQEAVAALLAQPGGELSMETLVRNSDLVHVASAFGQIKIMGKVAMRLRDLALASLKRLIIMDELSGGPQSYTYKTMLQNLESFPQNRPEPSDTAKVFMSFLGCPCAVFKDLYDDDDMLYAYEQATVQGREKGLTPVLIVVDDVLREQLESVVDPEDDGTFDPEVLTAYRHTALTEAAALDPEAVIAELLAELEVDEIEMNEDDFNPHATKIKKSDAITCPTSFWDFNTHLSQEVLLALIPTDKPWEIPVWIPMGGFNDCPEPEKQVAILKRWYEQYGAVPYVVSYDTWEFLVPQPVAEKDIALTLAWEHYAFCSDRILQHGSNYTLGHLAYSLMNSTVWYFWWD